MADSAARPGAVPALARINPRLLAAAALGGLLGGVVMFFLVAGYNASAGMGFLTLLNVCFTAWVFRGAGMTTAASTPERHMASPMPTHSAMASHAGMAAMA